MYEKLCSLENLELAFNKAKKGKTKRRYVKRFQRNLENNLIKLRVELLDQTYSPLDYNTFVLRDPKTRKISKSAFRDRVVHHALCNIIAPDFEKSFIYDSHANQIGKGTLKAIERFDKFKRKVSKNNTRECYVFKADIKHYFKEMNHDILIKIIKGKIICKKMLFLIEKIFAAKSATERERERDEARHYFIKGSSSWKLDKPIFCKCLFKRTRYFCKTQTKSEVLHSLC